MIWRVRFWAWRCDPDPGDCGDARCPPRWPLIGQVGQHVAGPTLPAGRWGPPSLPLSVSGPGAKEDLGVRKPWVLPAWGLGRRSQPGPAGRCGRRRRWRPRVGITEGSTGTPGRGVRWVCVLAQSMAATNRTRRDPAGSQTAKSAWSTWSSGTSARRQRPRACACSGRMHRASCQRNPA